MKLTVTCVFVRGHVPFTPEYVIRLRSMAARLLPAHRFVCLTDRPQSLPADIETVRVSPPAGVYAWWTKVQLFNPALQLGERIVYFDLDVVLRRDLIDIVEFDAPFAIVPDGAPNFVPKRALVCVKRFNSSVMVWDHGVHADLYSAWNGAVAYRLWGDQDWIGERKPDAATMPLSWFPRLSQISSLDDAPDCRVLLCKKPKNSEAAISIPWFNEAWQ